MANFDTLLKGLHGEYGATKDDDAINAIVVTADRRLEIPADFNRIIAYEGDINSQIITFDCPAAFDGHDLTSCAYKKVRWTNLASGIEGSGILTPVDESELTAAMKNRIQMGRQFLSWFVQPEAFTKSGKLQISLTLYDINEQGNTSFKWNTAVSSALMVKESMENFDVDAIAKDEILLIDSDTRRIIMPANYNSTIANYGDVGTTRVFFQSKRYIRGIDLFDPGTEKAIRWKVGDTISFSNANISVKLYSAANNDSTNKEGYVNIIWSVPEELTCNPQHYAGQFAIELSFTSSDGKRIWRTNAFDGLQLGKNLFMTSPSLLPESNGFYHINGNLTDGTGVATEVAGIYTLRSYAQGGEFILKKNELAVEYDTDGNYIGLKIGTKRLGEDVSEARYTDVFMQGKTIILDGGSASENIGGES